jgi:hypothetical protein
MKKAYQDLAIEIIGAGLVGIIVWGAGYLYFPLPAWFSIVTLLFGAIMGWLFCQKSKKPWRITDLEGDALSSTQFYPISTSNGKAELDMDLFNKAIEFFKDKKNNRAAFELCYLGQLNAIETKLSEGKIKEWRTLCKNNMKEIPENSIALRNNIFTNFKHIIEGVGNTLNSKQIEFVLHDVRNPVHSIVAIVNPISSRKIEDPITNFGVELIKNYNEKKFIGNEINYKIANTDVKGSTIPLQTEELGLFGFLCINIDTKNIKPDELLKTVTYTNPKSKVSESIK